MRRFVPAILAGAILFASSGAYARPIASQFTVVVQITPGTVTDGATVTLLAHTRIGSACTARVAYRDGARLALTPSRQHVGPTGIIYWHWTVRTTASSAQAFVSCQWKGQGRGAFANVTIQGRHDLPATARPKPTRPGVAVLGATKAAWALIFGPYLKSTTDYHEGWQACFEQGLTPRVEAAFREGHAIEVSGAYCTDNPPSSAERLKEAEQFFPVDASYLGKYSKSDGSGVDLEYFAPSLARAFTRGDFLDCHGNLVRPGTFSLSLAIPSAMDWDIQTGTCV
ncbi:MAG TPA: hypothetical protein VHB98_11620 [Chloroflexota bacterium]|nr:hypothetical protein [Chloroflexota bacterium]